MSDIYIRLNNEDADITDADLISSGDVDTVNVHFTFSEEWDAFPVKTMCVHAITKEEENRIGTNFIGITSEGLSVVPQGALAKAGILFIAVVGENPNKQVLTSTWVTLKIRKGADFLVPDDEVDVFGRLMPAGGNEGNILVKKSDKDFDYTWKPSSESLEAGLNITILDNVISSNCFREVEELPEEGIAGVIYILDGAMYTWSNGEYIQFGKTYVAGDGITINNNVVSTANTYIITPDFEDYTQHTYTSETDFKRAFGGTITLKQLYNVYETAKLNKLAIRELDLNEFGEGTIMYYSITDIEGEESQHIYDEFDNEYWNMSYKIYFKANDNETYSLFISGHYKNYEYDPSTNIITKLEKYEEQIELVAGDNITINGNTISATDTTYAAGDGIDITSGVVSTSASKVLNIAVADSESTTYNSDSLLENAIGVSYNDVKDVYNTKKLNKIVIHPYVDSTEAEDDNQRCSISDIEYYETTSEDTEGVITSENYEMIFNHITDATNSLVNIYSLIISKNFVDTTFANYTVGIKLKPYTNDIYALRKYYGNENINLGNNNGVPANTYGTDSKWNQAIGIGNEITGQYNEVSGNNNNINGTYNNITGYGLYVNGQFNVAFGPVMPEAKKLQGICNIVTAYGNDVSGNENAVFGNNNKVRGDAHLIAGHGHDVQGYNNLVTGEYSTVTGTDNAVFGINYGTIQGSSNIVNGYYTYIKGNSDHNIVGGSYHTVTGGNNLVVGEQTSNDSFTFPDDEEATTFDHINGYDNIYSGFMSSITGRYNILTASYGKILGNQNLVMGEHHAVKGSNNILTGSGGDGGFVGSNNIAVLGGYGSVINDVEYSNIISGYTTVENLRYAALNTFYSRFQNAQYINANGYGLKFSGTLDENDYYTNPMGLTIIGKWNEDGNDRNDYVFVVGGGTGDDINRKNVFTITTDGQVTCTINNKKHTVFGSSCVTNTLPQTGQEDTLYVLYEEEGTDTTDTTDDTITVLGMYIWKDGEYFALPSGGGGTSYIAGDGISISNNTISIDNIEVVNSLPAQGTENIFYQVQNYEQTFTLEGDFPTELSTQSDYESWNMGGKAMMLCVDTEATSYTSLNGIKYVLLTGITAHPVATASGGQDVYYQVTQVGSTPMMYEYSTITEEWTESAITQVTVNDYLFAVSNATGYTPSYTSIVISDSEGSISSAIGLEWMSGNDTSNQWSVEYRPSQYETHTYTYADNDYEIYTGNPYATTSSVYVYKNGIYTNLTSGGSSYVAGDNIDITGNVISADIIEPVATFTLTPTGTTPAYTVSCDTTYSELISRYNSDKLKMQLIIEGNNGETVLNMDRFEYRSGVAKFYFEYTEEDYLYVYEITKTGNPSADTYSYNKISTRVQPKLTAGTGISIDPTTNTISLDLPQAEGGGF